MRYKDIRGHLDRPTENTKQVHEFINEVIALSKKHGLSISHEDRHGAFEIVKYKEENSKWLINANDET